MGNVQQVAEAVEVMVQLAAPRQDVLKRSHARLVVAVHRAVAAVVVVAMLVVVAAVPTPQVTRAVVVVVAVA